MKKYIKSITLSVFCMAFSLIGCDDFLTEEPQSEYSANTFYKIQSDFEVAIAGVYAQQQGLFSAIGGVFRPSITRSDETVVGAGYVDENDKFLDNATGSVIQGMWSSLYIMVYRTNAILDRIDDVEFTNANTRDYIKGEALALRAWAYYTLGTSFGGVPLIDKTLSTPETLKIPRSTQAQTFAFAENDYKTAISLLPPEWTGKDLGRVTKYAAMGGLARLYMFQSNYISATPYLKEIIDSGKYKMAENYVDCFDDAFDNTAERLWEVQFMNGGLGEGNILTNSFLPEGYSGDLIPFSGASAYLEVSSDMINAYEEGDLRKEVSVVTNITVGSSIRTEWFIRKWLHYTAEPVNNNDFAINLPIIRYTDVILMYAECLNEAGYVANGQAFTLLNSVRKRAGLDPLTQATTPDQAAFRKAIIQERRVEFAFEGLRWWDLVRWDIALEVMDNFLKLDENQGGLYKMGSNERKLYAIPAQELANYNDETIMWQNPGF
ncbi:MAG: RagB/SusD family nutrient uptake outer membrane protein [Synergistaceae bacterium]|jgi:hypothetical protein|nr:RagB/SusD family nutrient uptake outer membrane protein [Synergistaceae bacterium]